MDWFKPLVENCSLHEKFRYIMKEPGYIAEKKIIEDWIKDFNLKDGEYKTVKEFQTTFHSVFWELYITQIIKNCDGTIDPGCASPDFLMRKGDEKVWIEAVVANSGQGRPEESSRTREDCFGDNDINKIMDESIVRFANSFLSKFHKYKTKYKDKIGDTPFVIAISDFSQPQYGQGFYYPPLAALYNSYFDPEDKKDLLIYSQDDHEDNEYKYIEEIPKYNIDGAPIPLGFFNDPTYEDVSGVLYSCTLTLGKLTSLCEKYDSPIKFISDLFVGKRVVGINRDDTTIFSFKQDEANESLADGLFYFHNPHAKIKIENDFFEQKGITFFDFDENDLMIKISPYQIMGILKRRYCIYEKDIEKYIAPV